MAPLLKTLINRSSKWNSTTMAARQLSRLTIQIRNHTIKSMLDIVASEFPGYNNAIPPSAVSTYNKVYKNEYISENNARKRELLLELTEGFYAGKWKFKQMGTCKADEYRSSLEGCGITTGVLHDLKAIEAAKFAISKLNEQNNEERIAEFVKLLRVNVMFVLGRWYYLTIEASDNNFYEARVFYHRDERILDFIRPAVHYPQVNPKFLKYDAPDTDEKSPMESNIVSTPSKISLGNNAFQLFGLPNYGDDMNEYISENNAKKHELLLQLTEGFYADKWKFKQSGICKSNEYRSSWVGCAINTWAAHDLKAIKAAKFAISKLNERDKEEKNVEFVKLVRVNVMSKSGRWYYLTIEASDNNFYEARVFCHHDEKILDFIRPAIHYPQVNPEFLKYDAPDNNERSHINPRFHIDLGTGRASSPFANDDVSKINCWKCKQLLDLTEGFYAGSWILKLSDKREPNEFWPRLDGAVFVIGDIMDFKPMEAAKFAISKLNEQDKEGKNVELVSLWRVNRFLGNGMWYYLTFEASDKKFYEAKVFVNGDVRNLDFIRLAVHFPQVNPEFLKYDVPKEMLNNRPSIQIWACGRGVKTRDV